MRAKSNPIKQATKQGRIVAGLSNGCLVRLALIALLVGSMPIEADDSSARTQDHEAIRDAAVAFVYRRYPASEPGSEERDALRVRPGHLDPRLRLKHCDAPLEAFSTGARALQGNASIGVQCPGSWKLYVPVRIEKPARVLASQHALTRGRVLSEEDLGWVLTDTLRLSQGYYTRIDQVLGHRIRQSIPADAVLTPPLIDEQPLIERGERVMLTLNNQAIGVRAPAEALEDARQGERIRVRNLSSGRTVEGIAAGPKRVEVQ